MPDISSDTFLRSSTILATSFLISLRVICSTSVTLEASRTSSAMKPYSHLPLFLATLSRYRVAYPLILLCLINLLGPSKRRYVPLLLFDLGVFLLYFGMTAINLPCGGKHSGGSWALFLIRASYIFRLQCILLGMTPKSSHGESTAQDGNIWGPSIVGRIGYDSPRVVWQFVD